MKITHLLQNKFYFVVVNECRFRFIQANSQFNPRRFDKPWQLMTAYGNIAKTKQDGSWVKYVFSLMPEKKIMKLCSASRMTFRAWIWRTDPVIILEDNSEHFRAFWETLFESERAKESPEIYFRPKRFRTIFEKRAPVYSLVAPLLGMAKSIYYSLSFAMFKLFVTLCSSDANTRSICFM